MHCMYIFSRNFLVNLNSKFFQRIVTTGTSAMSLLNESSLNTAKASLADQLVNSQQQQVSQYCALLDDCLRFERWVRLANREDIEVLCCSTDLCNA